MGFLVMTVGADAAASWSIAATDSSVAASAEATASSLHIIFSPCCLDCFQGFLLFQHRLFLRVCWCV